MPVHADSRSARSRIVVSTFILDVAAVVVFALLGQRSHEENTTIASLVDTAWPFLAGLLVGWLVSRPWRRPRRFFPSAALIWVSTVALGMLARELFTTGGVQFSFVLVAGIVLALFFGLTRGLVWLTLKVKKPRQHG